MWSAIYQTSLPTDPAHHGLNLPLDFLFPSSFGQHLLAVHYALGSLQETRMQDKWKRAFFLKQLLATFLPSFF